MPENRPLVQETSVFCGESLATWRSMPWWPNGQEARVDAGPPGHERELVVNLGEPGEYTWDNEIPLLLVDVLAELLPETWRVESRGTRIEIHPTGRMYGGFDASTDVPETQKALRKMGFDLR